MGATADIKKRKAGIARALLQALQDIGSATIEDAAACHRFVIIAPTMGELVAAAQEMKVLGMIENYIPGDYEVFRLTEKGLRQITGTAAKDPAVWFGAMV